VRTVRRILSPLLLVAGGVAFALVEAGLRLSVSARAVGPAHGADVVGGCSFTQGWGLDDTETYPWLLRPRLPDVGVRNFGSEERAALSETASSTAAR
jgi:hypothetical protein